MSRRTYTREALTALFDLAHALPASFAPVPDAIVAEPVPPFALTGLGKTSSFHPGGKTRQIRADIPQKQAAPRPAPPPKPAPPPAAPPAPRPAPPPLPVIAWFYIDKSGKVQGPFPTERLRSWWEKGLFPPDLQISVSEGPGTFRAVDQYFPDTSLAFLYNPILFPFLGPVQKTPGDPLEEIFLEFDAALTAQ
jgi:hypothetical protein